MLLVLDNCEHLIAWVPKLVQALLERCPELRILATSRERLGLMGESVWRVRSLESPDPERLQSGEADSIEQVQHYASVRLFIERAAMARPGFRLSRTEDARAAAQICSRLDGIPLAIELAAARLSLLSISQIAARLDDRFQLLTGGSRAALPRQQTLRALIDWSYDLLTADEQELLGRLGVFIGGWSMEAVEDVRPDLQAPDSNSRSARASSFELLASLIDKSLVHAEEQSELVRYSMLESVREYAVEGCAVLVTRRPLGTVTSITLSGSPRACRPACAVLPLRQHLYR